MEILLTNEFDKGPKLIDPLSYDINSNSNIRPITWNKLFIDIVNSNESLYLISKQEINNCNKIVIEYIGKLSSIYNCSNDGPIMKMPTFNTEDPISYFSLSDASYKIEQAILMTYQNICNNKLSRKNNISCFGIKFN